MFRVPSRGGNRDPLLPHSGNGRTGGGGLYGTARSSPKAALSKSFIATMAWALVSVVVAIENRKSSYAAVSAAQQYCCLQIARVVSIEF